MNSMISFALSEGVTLYCPKNGCFSFFNSPYYAHNHFTGVDIYPPPKTWHGAPALSPIDGEIISIKPISHFTKKDFNFSEKDYVILIKCSENPARVAKILHVKPSVTVGDKVKAGEKLGFYLRSGFFHFWTDPHIHVEIRDSNDPLRARGGYRIHRTLPIIADVKPLEKLIGIVRYCRPEYLLIALKEKQTHGLTVNVNGEIGVLEGGIPYYGFFGVHLNNGPKPGDDVILCGKKIGVIKKVFGNMSIAEISSLKPCLNGEEIHLSLHVYFQNPLVKIVSKKLDDLHEGEEVEITFQEY